MVAKHTQMMGSNGLIFTGNTIQSMYAPIAYRRIAKAEEH